MYSTRICSISCVCVFRLLVLFLVCSTQSWLLWKFFCFQLRRTREFRLEQARKRAAAKQQTSRTVKRDTGTHTHTHMHVRTFAPGLQCDINVHAVVSFQIALEFSFETKIENVAYSNINDVI